MSRNLLGYPPEDHTASKAWFERGVGERKRGARQAGQDDKSSPSDRVPQRKHQFRYLPSRGQLSGRGLFEVEICGSSVDHKSLPIVLFSHSEEPDLFNTWFAANLNKPARAKRANELCIYLRIVL